jgi:hypothetical protein
LKKNGFELKEQSKTTVGVNRWAWRFFASSCATIYGIAGKVFIHDPSSHLSVSKLDTELWRKWRRLMRI